MTVVLDRTFDQNQNGREGCFLWDGPRTHMVTVIGKDIVIFASEGYELERLTDLRDEKYNDFVIRTVDARVSGFDGKALVGCFGLDAGSGDSRVVYLKGNRVYER